MVKPAWMFKQSGVIPFRVVDDTIEVVLITSRSSGKWGIPKGIIERDLSPQDSAAKEAHEEAGVVGNVTDRVVAEYEYQKWGGTCKVQVFAMAVTTVLDEWDEKQVRSRKIVTLAEAIELVKPELTEVLKQFQSFRSVAPKE
jgi:8-oxo-dGTP pyrophosphatase MutT (NUDIX family)